jgi:hypothetical protein
LHRKHFWSAVAFSQHGLGHSGESMRYLLTNPSVGADARDGGQQFARGPNGCIMSSIWVSSLPHHQNPCAGRAAADPAGLVRRHRHHAPRPMRAAGPRTAFGKVVSTSMMTGA